MNDFVGFKFFDIFIFNRYLYVSNNFYKYVDFDGREKYIVSVIGEVIVVVGVRVFFLLLFDD